MIWQAPAKINLFLRVLSRRPDGYHEIFSLMQKISLSDELSFQHRPEGIVLHCSASDLPNVEDNLVFRAARLIFAHKNYTSGVEITLDKKIPTAAGLGGGSSDAAATLMALNELCSFGLSKNELMQLGLKLGADVPFFIFGDSAFATGIGENLTSCKNLPELHLVLLNPRFPLSTKSIYDNLNLRLTSEKINYSMPRLSALGDVVRELHNDLEEVSLQMHPELGDLKEILLRHGALGALMSGSGPTVFGIFSDEKSASSASVAISAETSGRYLVFFARSL
ncbi:MAG TPA: 4-(cytidine 5'-diphospho)-2-C-methyl-D-erythritol kinase [Smithellaceae bacterium]|nr:4-(cytidine 5'-diphospho)-2-C-methyl-D-erythritol kinase [Smithellaceae bacterium]HRS88970.1 4-(cytidine 5'-diphospho)-2-C-methyl-D-erythritol kinase [Smithellaceae bacterium]HRV25586.1 4-(cytidine 5'-diphospho)-2-C-methyl-D-erythritol kinase [Smithellaceae bacterium]